MPIYGSVDIRDFGWKVGVVDANHFPAGFNNISQEDRPKIAELLKKPLAKATSKLHMDTPVSRVTY